MVIKYFFFRSVINTVKISFFHISLLYCTRKNILIFALVQYELFFISFGTHRYFFLERRSRPKLKYEKWHSERTGIFSGSYKDDQDQQLNTRIYCMIFYKGLNREIFITI